MQEVSETDDDSILVNRQPMITSLYTVQAI